ncbi:MAG: hypothetical protein ACI35O_01965 [Bacillaceae bacterium]
MTEIAFLASLRPFIIPDEMKQFNKNPVVEREEDCIFFNVVEIDEEFWGEEIKGIFSMPYIYEAYGVGNVLFLKYIAKYMEIGAVIEIYAVPNQHDFARYKREMEKNQESILINIGSYTYQDIYGTYQLHPENWIEEIARRNYMTSHGVTKFVNY